MEKTMELTLLLLLVAIFTEVFFSPRLDVTIEGDILLWYGRINREFIIIYTNG
jgi:hypothetical protein